MYEQGETPNTYKIKLIDRRWARRFGANRETALHTYLGLKYFYITKSIAAGFGVSRRLGLEAVTQLFNAAAPPGCGYYCIFKRSALKLNELISYDRPGLDDANMRESIK